MAIKMGIKSRGCLHFLNESQSSSMGVIGSKKCFPPEKHPLNQTTILLMALADPGFTHLSSAFAWYNLQSTFGLLCLVPLTHLLYSGFFQFDFLIASLLPNVHMMAQQYFVHCSSSSVAKK